MSLPSTPSGFDRGAGAQAGSASLGIDQGLAEGRLERLNQAAAGLLEPLFLNTDASRLGVELAAAVQQSAAVANSVGLRGPDYLAALLVPFLQGPAGREFIAKDRPAFESWVQEVIAFFAGSMELAQVAGLVSQLDRWLGFAGVPPQFVALIAERLRSDLRQIRDWVRQVDPARYAAKSLPPVTTITRADSERDADADLDGSGDAAAMTIGEPPGDRADDRPSGLEAVSADAGDAAAVPRPASTTAGLPADASASDAATADASAAKPSWIETSAGASVLSDAPLSGAPLGGAASASPQAYAVEASAEVVALDAAVHADEAPAGAALDDAALDDTALDDTAATQWRSEAVVAPQISLWPPTSDPSAWGGSSQVALDELAMLADAARTLGADLIPTLLALEPPSGQPAWQEFIDEYLARLEHMANASEFIGAQVLKRVLSGLGAQLGFWMTTPAAIGEESRRLLLLAPDTLADLFTEITAFSVEQLVGLLSDDDWPSPLPESAQPSLTQALLAIEIIRSRQVSAEPLLNIDDNDLSLEIPSDADRSVVDNLLRELPQLSAGFSDAIDLLGRGDLRQLERAQRVAHTLKGSANTVGVRGIATLTHRLEDILQLLSKDASGLTDPLTRLLADTADCLAEMCDAVAEVGPAPTNAEAILREVVDATRVLLDGDRVAPQAGAPADRAPTSSEASVDLLTRASATELASERATDTAIDADVEAETVLDSSEAVANGDDGNDRHDGDDEEAVTAGHADTVFDPPELADTSPAAPLPAAALLRAPADAASSAGQPIASRPALRAAEAASPLAEASSIGDAAGVDSGADEMLRVPASVVSRLLEFANEAMIALAQMQERITVLGDTRAALRAGSERFQDLSMELERLVDVRGLALTGRSREADFDALELDEYNDLHTVSRRFAEAGADHKLVDHQFDQELIGMREQVAQLDRVQTDLREAALKTRMVPIETMAGRLQRAVRQAARQTGKDVELTLFGGESAIDGQLLQRLVDPLMHMLRNSVDHGIESPDDRVTQGKPRTGRIELAFVRDGAELSIRCADDGRGLDIPAIISRARSAGLIDVDDDPTPAQAARLILLPGFSTRDQATQLSGRGIGLDVVRERLRELRGRIDVASEPGQGLRLTLTMPVRLAAVPVMILRGPNHVIAVSVRDIEQIASIAGLSQTADGGQTLSADGVDYPAVPLESLLGLPAQALASEAKENVAMIVRGEAGKPVAVIAPEPGQTRNVILQPLAAAIPQTPGIGGVAVMGDGSVAPIIDLPELLARREVVPQYATTLSAAAPAAPVCLIVDDSVSVRRTMELFLQDLGLHVDSASDGIDAMALVDIRVPDLIIADLEMPRMNGVELASALRARADTASVPFIMITSRYSDKHKQLALTAGADIFLTKPYTEDELAVHVQRCLARGRR